MQTLFVDDEPDYLTPLSKRLARRGVNTVGVGSGEEALEQMRRQVPGREFDAVVLDLHLPGMSGMATLTELRAQYPQTPVIVLTGHAQRQEAKVGLERGAFCFLFKPIELETLLWCLQDAQREKALLKESLKIGPQWLWTQTGSNDSSNTQRQLQIHKERQE